MIRSTFLSIDDVVSRFAAAGYITDRRLATTVFLVSRLNKPVLLEGPAGVGKTELAKTLATVTGRRLLRLQCYEGQDETRALYEWDYGKQLLYTQMLREKINDIIADAPDIPAAVARIEAHDGVFFSDHFLVARPLLDAIRGEQPAVLLIDEVDRADEALEAVFLECLGEFQVSVPEIGTYTAKTPPYVVLTSNNTSDLSAALKRRCLHLFLDYPDAERELEIVRSKQTGLPEAAARQLVAGGARAARAAAAQEPQHLRDDRLGPHPDRARCRRARRGRARRHRQHRAEVRAGHAARSWKCCPGCSTRTASCPRPATPMGTAAGTRTAGSTITSTSTTTGRPASARRLGTRRPAAGPPARPRTSRAATTRATTAPPVPARAAAPHPVRARAAGRSRRSPGDGPAERSGAW